MNAIDRDLASAYERHGGRAKAFKHLGKKTAGQVGDAVKKGGKAVGKYFSDKIRKQPGAKLSPALKSAKKEMGFAGDVLLDPVNTMTKGLASKMMKNSSSTSKRGNLKDLSIKLAEKNKK